MPNKLKQLLILKDKLISEKDFQVTFSYFLDLIEQDEILDACRKISTKKIQPLIEMGVMQLSQGRQLEVQILFLLEIKKYSFYHGSFSVDGCQGAFFYFRDINVGLLTVTGLNNSGMTEFIRITMAFGRPAS